MSAVYLRIVICAETFEVLGFEGQTRPFDVPASTTIDGKNLLRCDFGLVDGVDLGVFPLWLKQNIERHPLADTHEDAPKIRIKPDAQNVPKIFFTPTTYEEIAAHLTARGKDALPESVCAHLRECFAHTEHATAKSLRALGYEFAEIKRLPRFTEAISRAQQAAFESSLQGQRAREKREQEVNAVLAAHDLVRASRAERRRHAAWLRAEKTKEKNK